MNFLDYTQSFLKVKVGDERQIYFLIFSQTVSKSISICRGPKIYYSNGNLLTFWYSATRRQKNWIIFLKYSLAASHAQ